MSENEIVDEVMTIKEVSAYLRLGRSTVYKLVNEGKVPGRKVGGTWRFSKRRLDEWLQERSDTSPASLFQLNQRQEFSKDDLRR